MLAMVYLLSVRVDIIILVPYFKRINMKTELYITLSLSHHW